MADDDTMILDDGAHVFLWLGSKASDVEIKLALKSAQVSPFLVNSVLSSAIDRSLTGISSLNEVTALIFSLRYGVVPVFLYLHDV